MGGFLMRQGHVCGFHLDREERHKGRGLILMGCFHVLYSVHIRGTGE